MKEKTAIVSSVSGTDSVAEFQAACAFPLDPFQQEAIRALADGQSVLVAAPTSSGKTIVAEYAIHRALREGRRVIYTSPLKALSNQKFGDFCRVWGAESIGLLTGDISVNTGAPIRVMTTEVLRNMLLQAPDGVAGVQSVVLDEFHYLGDADRGRVWEEIVILLPRDIQLVCLSATMSNAGQMRAWVERVHGPTTLITSTWRPVPLEVHYFLDDRLHRAVDANGRQVARIRAGGEARRGRHFTPPGVRRGPRPPRAHETPTPPDVVTALAGRDMLPAIFFVFSRARTEREAERCAASSLDLITTDAQRQRIELAISETMAFMRDEHRELPQVETMMRLLRRGFAFHHAGLLPGLKVLVETLFTDGVIGVVFATETLALGVNMPARSVVIPQLIKFDGTVRRPLDSREFHQLIGRAGRRGMDHSGNAVLVYDEWMSFDEAMAVVKRPLEPVLSSFQLGYNSVVNLLRTYREPDVLVWLMNQSLLAHQMVGQREALIAERARIAADTEAAGSGCLIGGPDTLPEFERLGARLEAQETRIEELTDELRHARRHRTRGLPDDEIRRHVRQAHGGELAFLHDIGWCTLVPQAGGPLAIPLAGLAEGGRRRRLSLNYDQVEGIRPRDRIDLDVLPRLLERGTEPLSPIERRALVGQLTALDLAAEGRLHESPAELERAAHLRQIEERLAAAQTARDELATMVQTHRCGQCPMLAEHRKQVRRPSSNRRLLEGLDHEIAQLAAAEQRDLREVVGDVVSLLERYGYIEGGACMPKADVLARIVDTNTLIITELIMGGQLNRLPVNDLAEVVSWFAEPDADGQFQNLKGSLRDLWAMVHDVGETIIADENRHSLYYSSGPSPSRPGFARAWARGMPFAQLIADYEVAEGDGIKFLKKAGDLLRQVRRALEETGLQPELRERVAAAETAVRRDIVMSQELLELSEVIDVAEEELPPDVREELADITEGVGLVHPPAPHEHHIDLRTTPGGQGEPQGQLFGRQHDAAAPDPHEGSGIATRPDDAPWQVSGSDLRLAVREGEAEASGARG